MQMYVVIVALIILHVLNNLLAQNSHQWCHKVQYMQILRCDIPVQYKLQCRNKYEQQS